MSSTKSKRKLLGRLRLYIIVDKDVLKKKSLVETVNKIKNTDTAIIQLRDKRSEKNTILRDAQDLGRLLLKSKCLFIINDYVSIAKIVDCDGVHLGQEDTSVKIARKILGRDKIIGVSCHSLKEAQRAEKQGADYLGIGPVFATSLKPKAKPKGLNLLSQVSQKIKIPFFAVGGINKDNLNQILSRGIKRVAVCRSVCQARSIPLAVKNFSQSLS